MACFHLGLLGLQQPFSGVLCLFLAAWKFKAACQPLRHKVEKPHSTGKHIMQQDLMQSTSLKVDSYDWGSRESNPGFDSCPPSFLPAEVVSMMKPTAPLGGSRRSWVSGRSPAPMRGAGPTALKRGNVDGVPWGMLAFGATVPTATLTGTSKPGDPLLFAAALLWRDPLIKKWITA